MRPNADGTTGVIPAFETISKGDTARNCGLVDAIDKDSAAGMELELVRVSRIVTGHAIKNGNMGVRIPRAPGWVSAVDHDACVAIALSDAAIDSKVFETIGVLDGIDHDTVPAKADNVAVDQG